ncbi:MAG: hypothetical protein AAF657_14620 [Acidobacteriota bacterium]
MATTREHRQPSLDAGPAAESPAGQLSSSEATSLQPPERRPAQTSDVSGEPETVDDLDLVHPGTEEATIQAKLHPYAGAAAIKSGLEGWQRWVSGAVTVFLLSLVVAFAWYWGEAWYHGRQQPATGGSPTASAAGTVEAAAVAAPDSSPGESPQTADEPTADNTFTTVDDSTAANESTPAEDSIAVDPPSSTAQGELQAVLGRVEAWAEAWANQRVDDYLASYASSFEPPRGMSRADWNALRRKRIERPRRIEVQISEVEAELLGTHRARVRFRQTYASDSYRDTTRKALELVLEASDWKITTERAAQ